MINKTATTSKKTTRRRMSAKDLEERVYGVEPIVPDLIHQEMLSSKERQFMLNQNLNWYASSFDKKKAAAFIPTWLSKQSYFSIDKKQISSIDTNFFISTYYGLMRMETNGLSLSSNEIEKIKTYIYDLVANSSPSSNDTIEEEKKDSKDSSEKKKKSPREHLLAKMNSFILNELEALLDDSLLGKNKDAIDIEKLLIDNEVKGSAQAISIVSDWIQSKSPLLTEIKNKSNDPEIEEGYSNLNKTDVNRTLRLFKALETSLNTTVKANVTNRKKKTTTKSSVGSSSKTKTTTVSSNNTSVLKYQVADKENNVTSIDPAKIIGKTCLILWDTKYRNVRFIYCKDDLIGFGVKGTASITNVDETRCFSQKLRKPSDILPLLLTKTRKQCEKMLSELTTTKNTNNVSSRLNQNIIILRAF